MDFFAFIYASPVHRLCQQYNQVSRHTLDVIMSKGHNWQIGAGARSVSSFGGKGFDISKKVTFYVKFCVLVFTRFHVPATQRDARRVSALELIFLHYKNKKIILISNSFSVGSIHLTNCGPTA